MSRLFAGSSNTDYLSATLGAHFTTPFTMMVWFKPTTVAACYMFAQTNSANSAGTNGGLGIDSNSKFIAGSANNSAAIVGAVSSATVSANVWHLGIGVFSSTTARSCYFDGVSATGGALPGSTTTGTPTLAIGIRKQSGAQPTFTGEIAHAAVWNVALTAAECALLWTRELPTRVRRDALIYYYSLMENSSSVGAIQRLSNADHLSITGSVGLGTTNPSLPIRFARPSRVRSGGAALALQLDSGTVPATSGTNLNFKLTRAVVAASGTIPALSGTALNFKRDIKLVMDSGTIPALNGTGMNFGLTPGGSPPNGLIFRAKGYAPMPIMPGAVIVTPPSTSTQGLIFLGPQKRPIGGPISGPPVTPPTKKAIEVVARGGGKGYIAQATSTKSGSGGISNEGFARFVAQVPHKNISVVGKAAGKGKISMLSKANLNAKASSGGKATRMLGTFTDNSGGPPRKTIRVNAPGGGIANVRGHRKGTVESRAVGGSIGLVSGVFNDIPIVGDNLTPADLAAIWNTVIYRDASGKEYRAKDIVLDALTLRQFMALKS